MHHDGVHSDLLEQGDVVAELLGEVLFAHGVAAVLHHHRRAGVAAQEGQRVRQHLGLPGGRFDVDRIGGEFAHAARVGRRKSAGQVTAGKRRTEHGISAGGD